MMQTLEKRRFVAYWGEGYKEEVKIVDEDFFSEDLGYRPEHVVKVMNLGPLEAADLTEMNAVHMVLRVK